MKAVKLRKTGRWMAVACAMVAASFSAGTVFASDLQNCYLSSVQVQSTTLRELFGLIEQRFNYSFLIRSNDINLEERVVVDFERKSVEEILKSVLRNQQADFIVNNKRIIIYNIGSKPNHGKASKEVGVRESQQVSHVSGTVIDAVTGDPVIGASVVEKGTTNGGITDIDGKFSIELKGTQKILEIS